MLLHGASDLDRRCLKTRRSAVIAFLGGSHQISLPLPPKLLTKPHLGGPFNAKSITDRALHKWHDNRAKKLKLYNYIGIGKYSSVCQNFSSRGRPGSAGPLMYIWDHPPNISEITTARKLKIKTHLDVVKYSLSVPENFR